MSKYVIEVNDDDVDDHADELIGRMVGEGGVQLVSPSLDLDVRVVGKATHMVYDPLPGSATTYIVEPLS